MPQAVHLFWFRRDLRLEDNAALHHALGAGLPVVPIFIFDRHILDGLEDRDDNRVSFIYQALEGINKELGKWGSAIDARYGKPLAVWKELLNDYDVKGVYANTDYEPYARERDTAVHALLQKRGAALHLYKDQVIFERSEIVKGDGGHYTIYTPYAKRWRAQLTEADHRSYPVKKNPDFLKHRPKAMPTLASMKFKEVKGAFEPPRLDESIIRHYDRTRDTPSIEGTTRLGVHLRFGTISIRKLVSHALQWNSVYLGELIWREFFMQLLWHRPDVADGPCRKEYAHIRWRNNEKEFERWCRGETGYPLVDAGMRELNETGFMHNRVRMVAASFLVKHLLIDWRWGEAYFARRLRDYELANNNGNWQWVAGCGCDSAPYFRVFNPAAQTKRFDPQMKYIARWVPEWQSMDYSAPMVEHEAARARCLKVYKEALARARATV